MLFPLQELHALCDFSPSSFRPQPKFTLFSKVLGNGPIEIRTSPLIAHPSSLFPSRAYQTCKPLSVYFDFSYWNVQIAGPAVDHNAGHLRALNENAPK